MESQPRSSQNGVEKWSVTRKEAVGKAPLNQVCKVQDHIYFSVIVLFHPILS